MHGSGLLHGAHEAAEALPRINRTVGTSMGRCRSVPPPSWERGWRAASLSLPQRCAVPTMLLLS